jgi:hypothetical protein
MHELQVTVLLAYDWTMFGDQMRLTDIEKHDCLQIYVVGFIVSEDDDFISLSQQVFNEELPNIRFTLMIPKVCIIDRKDLEFFPKEEEE